MPIFVTAAVPRDHTNEMTLKIAINPPETRDRNLILNLK